jgi:hypothetical protein
MNRDIGASLTATWLKQPDGLEQDQNYYRQITQQQPATGVDNVQLLISLPFEIMRQYMESTILQQLETATGIYSKQIEELDNVFTKHVDKFDKTVSIGFKDVAGAKQ